MQIHGDFFAVRSFVRRFILVKATRQMLMPIMICNSHAMHIDFPLWIRLNRFDDFQSDSNLTVSFLTTFTDEAILLGL